MFRNFIRNKAFSFITIIGLAVGLACVILIFSWVKFELSFDQYHQYSDRIYRIQRKPFCTLAPSFAPLMKQDFPEIEKLARMVSAGECRIKYKEKTYIEDKVYFSEPEIFDILSLDMLYGDRKTALAQRNSIVLTETIAHKYFGNENPIGKILMSEENVPFNVTGVIRNIPVNSHGHFNFLISYLTLKIDRSSDDYFFGSHNFSDNVCLTYVRLTKGTNPRLFEAKTPKFIDRYVGGYEDDKGKAHFASEYTKINLMKVTDIHLYSHENNEIETNGDIKYVKIFSLVAFFILLIACINFINLSIAKSLRRAKEVSLRKVLGSMQSKIIFELILESIFYILISLFFAIVLYETVTPYFNGLWNGMANHNLLSDKTNILVLVAILIFAGITAGLYPAVFISRFKPNDVLKNCTQIIFHQSSNMERSPLRKSLIVFQFSISIAMMICIGVISNQLRFIQNSNLGFNKENVVLIPADGAVLNKWNDFKQVLLGNTGIVYVTKSKRSPSDRLLDDPGFEITVNGKLQKHSITMPHNRVEQDFFKTYGINIAAGRDFDIKNPTDASKSAILNETAIKQLGFKNNLEAIGTIIKIEGENRSVIGVSKDFHYESLHHKIVALVTYVTNESNTIAIRIAPGNIKDRMKVIEKVWNRFHNGSPLVYSFLDIKVNQQYQDEQRMLKLFNYFGLLAIFIACLGLYGLAAYSTERRKKEIGIRKTNGATTAEVMAMLAMDFTKWVVVAFVIVCPIAYYLMYKWLQNFAYKIVISWWIFMIAGFIAFLIALLTVSWQSWRAANRNPVEALKYE
jgi:putative ABC transport system permease protein